LNLALVIGEALAPGKVASGNPADLTANVLESTDETVVELNYIGAGGT